MKQSEQLTSDEIETVRTFLAMFYQNEDDLVGSTKALKYAADKEEYEADISHSMYNFIRFAEPDLMVATVREFANRDVQNFYEAFDYLNRLFEMNIFHLLLHVDQPLKR